ncbi:FIST C-terminal domain-containing protein [Kiloniella sp. EL199]|uniref:FIST signal transduction protein n=1 Tax=Kiloniella sp. EL199 TaxID=2107581 RepID=UPI001C1FD697|nr:FIST C-terminal domain-containing protein [Kiloniella sp. EL199]
MNMMQEAPRFKAAFSSSPDWSKACAEILNGLGDLPPEANLGCIYVTDIFADDLSSILTFLKTKTGLDNWTGTVGIGIGANAANQLGRFSAVELYDEPGVSVMISSFPSGSFQVFESGQMETDEGIKLAVTGEGVEKWLETNTPYLGLIHGDPRHYDLPLQISSLSAGLETYLVGGLSSSRGELPQIANHITDCPLSGVFFNDSIPAITGLTQGCTPIGPKRVITSADEQKIYTIDGRSALDVLKEDIGELLSRDLSKIGGYIFVGFSVEGSDSNDYLVRNLMSIDTSDGSLNITEEVSVGQPIFFCRRDNEAARKDLNRLLDDMRARLPRAPKAGLYYSCLGRGQALFGPNSEELNILRQEFGDMPMVGFYANGEVSHDRLYGYTGVLTLFY